MPGLKDDLLQLAEALGIPRKDFEAVGIHAWPAILQKIEAAFVMKTNSNTRFNWWWESFKKPQYRIFFEKTHAWDCLPHVVTTPEKVWFVACDDDHDPSKFWLFEGTIHAIHLLLGNSHAFEYYIISKKYAWLLCETDHSVLVGLGSIIPVMQALYIPGTVVLGERATVKSNKGELK
jgi:hypothetical protein